MLRSSGKQSVKLVLRKNRRLWWEGFVGSESLKPGVKERRSYGWTEPIQLMVPGIVVHRSEGLIL